MSLSPYGRDHDGIHAVIELFNLLQGCDPVFYGHNNIEKDDIGLFGSAYVYGGLTVRYLKDILDDE